jgi:hypothetical protein
MNKDLKIGFDQKSYDSIIAQITNAAQVYFDTSKELEKLKIRGIKADLLTKGGFMKIFLDYQKNEFEKSVSAKELDLTFEKFLDLRDLNTEKLNELEDLHEKQKDKSIELFEYNNSFFNYAEIFQNSNFALKRALEKAPKKQSFQVSKLYDIKSNKIEISLKTEPFDIYAFNKEQIQLMYDIADYIKAAKVIELTYKDVWPYVEKYLHDDLVKIPQHQTGEHGLSQNLEKVIFSFNKVLTYKI